MRRNRREVVVVKRERDSGGVCKVFFRRARIVAQSRFLGLG